MEARKRKRAAKKKQRNASKSTSLRKTSRRDMKQIEAQEIAPDPTRRNIKSKPVAKRAILVIVMAFFVSLGGIGMALKGVADIIDGISGIMEQNSQAAYFQNNQNSFMAHKSQVSNGENP